MQQILDLERYPLDQPESAAYRELVSRCRAELAQNGMFNLVGFMRADAAATAVTAMRPKMETESFTHQRSHNIYFKKDIPGLPDDHPALVKRDTINHTLCADQVTPGTVVDIYEYEPLATFLADVMDKPALYTMPDPLARVNVMAYREGEALNWHFDRSEFTTTLLLEAPAKGGAFEYRSDLRTDADPNYDGVARLLNGTDDKVRQITLSEGTLNVFRGKNTAHRVTPVGPGSRRMIAVFSYYERPDVMFSDEERIGFFGRAG